MGGTRVVLENDNAKLQVAAWQTGGRYELLLANPQGETQVAKVKLPQAPLRVDLVLGKGEVKLVDGVLEVSLGPEQAVQVTAPTTVEVVAPAAPAGATAPSAPAGTAVPGTPTAPGVKVAPPPKTAPALPK